jgi:hypothetical protein
MSQAKHYSRRVVVVLAGFLALCVAVIPVFNGRLGQYLEDRDHVTRIDFYGKVVDAGGAPIAGAEVTIDVDGYNPLYYLWGGGRDSTKKIRRTTDKAGEFSVEGFYGDSLSVMAVSFSNYEWFYETRPHDDYDMDTGFSYAPRGPSYVPDPKHPAIFPMVKPGEILTVLPSRGGSQRGHDGRLTPNGAMTPKHPSVPGALIKTKDSARIPPRPRTRRASP